MINRPPAIIALLCAFIIIEANSQSTPKSLQTTNTDTLRIMDYNLLNYPGSTSATRNPYFRAVVHSSKPDVLVTLENTSSAGVTLFRDSVLNYYQTGFYSTIAYHDGYDSDPHIFFKTTKVTFLSANYIPTALRDIGEYILRVNSSGDTIRLFAVHLKASDTPADESKRLAEATILRNYISNLPANSKFMIMGDFNFYRSTDSAYQKLTRSEANNIGRAKDPINQVGLWHDGSAYAPYHTQSTRVAALSDGGASGGLDDRFDFIFTSYSSLDSNTIVSSYKAYGNDGNHLNQSINVLPNTAVPDSVADGVYYSSDHLPIICDFKFGGSIAPFSLILPTSGSTGQAVSVTLRWHSSSNATSYDVYLGTTNPPTSKVSSSQTDTAYFYSGLANNTIYYWKVVAKNINGSTDATGSPWNFTTISPVLPGDFSLAYPLNGATDNSSGGKLIWNTSQYATTYDVYLDTIITIPTRVSLNQTDTSYSYIHLLPSTTYYWKVIAKNVAGNTVAAGSPYNFIVGNIPIAPTNLGVTYTSDKSIHLAWTDNAGNETGYRVYKTSTGLSIVHFNLPPNSTSYFDTLLFPNTNYIYEVVPFNEFGEGMFDSVSAVTHASVPDVKDYFDYGTTSIFVVIDAKTNPVMTEYLMNVTNDTLVEKYVQTDSTLGITPVWRSFSLWGGNSGVQVKNLNPNTTYYISIKARNLENISTDPSPLKNITTNNFSISSMMNQGWNLISVPVSREDMRKITLFPFAASAAFAYENGYSSKDTLNNGRGYWMKFNSAAIIEMAGNEIKSDTIDVVSGWNLIGTISSTYSTASILQDPSDIVASVYYEYNEGYKTATELVPLKAYWVKISQPGKLILNIIKR
jgi:hypothetical protein